MKTPSGTNSARFIAGLGQLEGAPLSVPSAQCLFFLLETLDVLRPDVLLMIII
jgi:hypothetical protein